ncbi:MAG TPA: 2,3-bisphosphoglycerate-independent phosphoglycerate mutase, partial [Kiloniellaceae bacterium]
MTKTTPPRPVVLCILDGWGHRESCENNAICEAPTPNLDRLFKAMPHALVDASESEVGLPAGQMGNSEVGHMNLGAGRVVMQDLPRIDAAIADGSFAKNPALQDAIAKLKQAGGTAHVMGLISPGGVHSHQDQIAVLAEELAEAGLPVAVHAFLDGRDTPPRSALDFLKAFQAKAPRATIATVSGRYYAMDRDKRWARVEKAYRSLVQAEGERAGDALAAVERSYAAGTNDEFVLPTVIGDYRGMQDGDGLFMGNFRADRAREILTALLDPAFDGFRRERRPDFACALGLVEYSTDLNAFLTAIFPPENLSETLGELVAKAGKRQLRIAETEKYAHVTFFFNGGREELFEGEERI